MAPASIGSTTSACDPRNLVVRVTCAVEGPVGDQRARQQREGEEAFVAAVEPDPQPAAAQQPGDRALDLPAMAAKPSRGLDPAPGDPHLDPTAAQVGPATRIVVGFVAVDLAGPAAALAGRGRDRRDLLHEELEQG